jgi:putative addiction module component (TIGR02574 family)
MSEPAFRFDFRQLSIDDRLRLVEEIWNSIAEEAEAAPDVLPLTDEQRAELARRVAEHERDPGSAVPWGEALTRIEGRLRDRRRGG